MSLRAISFVRRAGAYGAGHVGWAFEYRNGKFNCGSVENDLGMPVAAVVTMDFWTCNTFNLAAHMRERHYDAYQIVEIATPHPQAAWEAVVWISRQPYLVLGRNCLDDVYDVMRAYGVPNLPVPEHEILPARWFELLPGDPQPLEAATTIPLRGLASLRARLPGSHDDCDIPATATATPPPWRVKGAPHEQDFLERLLGEHRGTPVTDKQRT
ncbi:MAG: hypothetical protein H0X24_09650 [Ktedonobacterales bacterium]|nr:hypothetical protein [Ktedonobacterales bacterium]